ncbi:hypothetical protein TNCV_1300561 [Trichonephila clavipes]|nr:hypothetical protein TNCV_1300561 [Trichonephila clavipes]
MHFAIERLFYEENREMFEVLGKSSQYRDSTVYLTRNLLSPAELGYGINRCRIFSSVSDEWSRDLKSVQVQKQRSCRAQDLDESPDPSMSKIVLRNLIISSKYYKEEEAKELLEVITAERLETEQQQKLEQQEQLSIEKLRLEMELSRIANQSATQNNGQTSRVKIFR